MSKIILIQILNVILLLSCTTASKDFKNYTNYYYRIEDNVEPERIYYQSLQLNNYKDSLEITTITDSVRILLEERVINQIDTTYLVVNYHNNNGYFGSEYESRIELSFKDSIIFNINDKSFQVDILEFVHPVNDGEDNFYINKDYGILMIKNKSWFSKLELREIEGTDNDYINQVIQKLNKNGTQQ